MTKKQYRPLTGFAAAVLSAAVLTGCATAIPGASIKPGVSVAQVEQSVGKPDMVWRNSQGKVIQAAYSDQPAGFVTFMVYYSDEGTVTRVEQVMDVKHFSLVKNGMTGNQVHKILGPERSVDHYKNLNQIYWNYCYCTYNNGREVYSVSFDERTMLVNGAITTPDPLFSLGDNEEGWCEPYFSGDTYAR